MNLSAGLPAAEYHAARGLYMTSHRMIAARKSREAFIEDVTAPRADTDALYFGRAAHTYTLEGPAAFWSEYVVGGPTNPKTGKTYGVNTKAYRAWAAEQPFPAITPEEFELIESMDAAVRRNRAAMQLLAKGAAEVSGRTELCGVPCQIRLDWMTADKRIVDLKTCSDLGAISIAAECYGYPIQQAFYRQVAEKLTGIRMPCYLVWVSKETPAQCVVWKLDDDRLDSEAAENERVLEEFRELFFQLREKSCRPKQPESSLTTSTKARHPRSAAAT